MRQICSQLEGSVESTIPKKPSSLCSVGQLPVLNGVHGFLNVAELVVSIVLVVVTDVGEVVGLSVVGEVVVLRVVGEVVGLSVVGEVVGLTISVTGTLVGSLGFILQHTLPQQV